MSGASNPAENKLASPWLVFVPSAAPGMPGRKSQIYHTSKAAQGARLDVRCRPPPHRWYPPTRLFPDQLGRTAKLDVSRMVFRVLQHIDLVDATRGDGAVVADTSFIAQLVDECLFVVSWNKTPW